MFLGRRGGYVNPELRAPPRALPPAPKTDNFVSVKKEGGQSNFEFERVTGIDRLEKLEPEMEELFSILPDPNLFLKY